MSCVVINGPTFNVASQQIDATRSAADLFEFRLDLFAARTHQDILTLKKFANKPVIFTLRPSREGGQFLGCDEDRLEELEKLCELRPNFVDLESYLPIDVFLRFNKRFPETKIICSYHDLEGHGAIPFLTHSKRAFVSVFKIAIYAHCITEALALMSLVKHSPQTIGISMGEKGVISRLLSSRFNQNGWTYFTASIPHAPGQLCIQETRALYGEDVPGRDLFGLIGYPTSKSISHYTHNAVMKACGLKAIYLKMDIEVKSIPLLLKQLVDLGWRGLSVTMPLKEAVLPFLDLLDNDACKIGAVNTITFENGRLRGFNTDGRGAVSPLLKRGSITGKTVGIIGCGGAAKAIGYEIMNQGGEAVFYCRNESKGKLVAQHLTCTYQPIEKLKIDKNDVLINCTPSLNPYDDIRLDHQPTVMDINTLPLMSPFLEKANSWGCPLVYGYQMFASQASLQFLDWFPHLDSVQLEENLNEECMKYLRCLKNQ
ncbi:MAG: type I 3-dehydroquinate dehydratase [Parachlamydiaceae bacterium]